MNWLDNHADGLALMLWVATAGLLVILVAMAIECWRSRPMRHRRRQRDAYARYTESIQPRVK